MNLKQIKNFLEDNFKPTRMVLTGVGNVDHGHLVSLSEKYFGDLENTYPRKLPSVGGIRFTGSEVIHYFHFMEEIFDFSRSSL